MSTNRSRMAMACFPAIIAILLLLASTAVPKPPATTVRAEVPAAYKWDLSPIFPDWEAWEAGMAEAEAARDELAGLRGTLAGGPEQLVTAMQALDKFGMLTDRVSLYAGLKYVTDMSNNDLAARSQRSDMLESSYHEATAWLNPELLAIPWDTMKKWLDGTSALAPYRHDVENLYRQRAHVLDQEGEQLLSYFSNFNSSPDQIYNDFIISDIKFPYFELPDGDSIRLSEVETWHQIRVNPDQQQRADMFATFYHTFHDYINTYASTYNSILQRDWAMARARNYETTLNAALDDDDVPSTVFETLVSTVRANTEPLQRYHRIRKEYFGYDHYYWSDRQSPLVDEPFSYDYDEVVPWVIESVKPLGEEYQKETAEIFDGRWIDVYANDGKYSGGFQTDAYGIPPYILMNFDGTLSEVFTLAHEVGHAMHTKYAMANQPYSTYDYTLFVAEVASTLNEALFLESLMDHFDDPRERVAILQQAIENLEGTFFLQTLFADFEWKAHELVESGQPVTADALRAIYGNLLTDYYGDAIEIDSLYYSYWTRISHFFDSPYYVYKYATCFATSAQLAGDIFSDNPEVSRDGVNRYLDLLRSGGDDYPMKQLQKAGVDLTQPEPFEAVVAQLDDLVTRLEAELGKMQGD